MDVKIPRELNKKSIRKLLPGLDMYQNHGNNEKHYNPCSVSIVKTHRGSMRKTVFQKILQIKRYQNT